MTLPPANLPYLPPAALPVTRSPECLANQYYQPLLRFALGLTRGPCQATDLVQQTFYLWALRGHQLREPRKAKSWLYTTLYREFLREVRRRTYTSEVEFDDDLVGMPTAEPRGAVTADAAAAVRALHLVPEPFRAPLRLFYLEELSYLEIAHALDIPLGTVMSRLSRGRTELRDLFHGWDAKPLEPAATGLVIHPYRVPTSPVAGGAA